MPNRTLCAVLEEMRKCTETQNYSYIRGLIEEAQTLGNRMEAALYDVKDHKYLLQEIKKLKTERDRLKEEKDSSDGNA